MRCIHSTGIESHDILIWSVALRLFYCIDFAAGILCSNVLDLSKVVLQCFTESGIREASFSYLNLDFEQVSWEKESMLHVLRYMYLFYFLVSLGQQNTCRHCIQWSMVYIELIRPLSMKRVHLFNFHVYSTDICKVPDMAYVYLFTLNNFQLG